MQRIVCEHLVKIEGSSLDNIEVHLGTHSEEQLMDSWNNEHEMGQLILDQALSPSTFKSISISSELLSLLRKDVQCFNQISFHSSLNVPFKDSEFPGYSRIFNDPHQIRSHQTLKKFSKEINTLFKKQIKIVLNRTRFVSLVIDTWTTRDDSQTYLAVIAYIVPNSALIPQLKMEFMEKTLKDNRDRYQCKIVLGFVDIDVIKRSGDDINEYITSLLSKYDITDKIMAITTGNIGDNKSLIENISSNLKRSSHILGNGLNPFLVKSTNQVLNKIADSIYSALNKKMGELLTKIEYLAYFLNGTTKIRTIYSEYSARILPPKEDEGWYSEFLMLEIFVEDYTKIMNFAANNEDLINKMKRREYFEYTASEIEVLRFIVEKTKVFKHLYYSNQNDGRNSLLNSITFYKVLGGYFEDITSVLDYDWLEVAFENKEGAIDPSRNEFPLDASHKEIFDCIIVGKAKFLKYFDLFSNEVWYFIVDFLTP